MRLAVLMDPLTKLKPAKDTTLAMMQRAQQFGWSVAMFTLNDVFCEQGQAFANLTATHFSANDAGVLDNEPWFGFADATNAKSYWITLEALGKQPLAEFDIILMRKDPPFNLEYILATYVLELAENTGVLVANKPQSLRDVNEKFFTLRFPQCTPVSLVTNNMSYLRQFWQTHRSVIFKPLDGMGGNSVFHVANDGQNLSVILEMLTERETVSIMAQTYIPEISSLGDKRIILINGEPIAYGLARIPQKGELRGNLAAGASSQVVPLTERDRWICAEIAPTLKAKGLYFVGIDVIGDYLTEINVTSPTCACEISAKTGLDIVGDYLTFLETLI